MYELDDSGWAAAEAVVREWTGIAFRVGPMDAAERALCVYAVERLYRVAGMVPPPRQRIIIVPSPMMARAVAGAAAWIWHCRERAGAGLDDMIHTISGNPTLDAVSDATSSDVRDLIERAAAPEPAPELFNAVYIATGGAVYGPAPSATDRATRQATESVAERAAYGTPEPVDADAAFWLIHEVATHAIQRAAYGTESGSDPEVGLLSGLPSNDRSGATVAAIVAACRNAGGEGGCACAFDAIRMLHGGNELTVNCSVIAFGRDHARLHERGLVDPALYERWQPWEDLTRISGWRFMHKDFCIVSDRCVALHLDAENRLHNENGPARLWADGFAIHAVHGVVGAPA